MSYDGAGQLFALGLRLTRLDASGAPLVGDDNCYTTDSLVRIGFGQTYSDPDAIELDNGKGITCVFYAPPKTLQGGTIEELRLCTPDPYVLQFLSGGDIITAGGTNEVQTATITGTPTGGTFRLTFDGEQTAPIAFNAAAAAVQAALIALPNLAAGDLTVTGGPGPGTPYVITFTGGQAGVDVPAITAAASLTGGTSPAITVANTTPGAPGSIATGYRAPQVNVDPTPNGVAIEAWTNAILNNAIDGSLPYAHWVIGRARVTPTEAYALTGTDPTQPVFEGVTEQNPEFGSGPLGDILFPTDRIYQYNRVATIPDLTPGLIAVA